MPRRSPRKNVRDVLNAMWETLDHEDELGVSEETGIISADILMQLKIRVHALEIDPLGDVSMTIDDPPFLFDILLESDLRQHPLPEEMDSFHEYPELSESPETESSGAERPETESLRAESLRAESLRAESLRAESPEAESPEGSLDLSWTSEARARAVSDYITDFALNPSRKNLPPSCRNLGEHVGLSPISLPDPFLLGNGLDCTGIWFWRTQLILEAKKRENGQPSRPHIIMTTIVNRVGQNDSILYEELVPLVSAMRNRANQPEVPPAKWESLFEMDEQKLPDNRVFKDEKTFPVLMLSFLGPQHARVFYARMKNDEVIIGQSELYSFERKNTANIELFARLLLSTPVRE
ncbi:hypothetical protein Plec18167_000346 [Paecilomyces lecythidis]|uniref:Uncharacterized protein n=1 Tax=Paecilomyces lecythidis TaxID=3004212 RepID=A0ABR3YDM6_9EURO